MQDKYFKAENYLLSELKKRGIEILYDHSSSTNSNFRYFVFKGQKIELDDYNQFRCPVFCAATTRNVKNMLEIMDGVKNGKRNVYSDFTEIGGSRKLDFVWGSRDSMLVMEFSDDLVSC